jgi:hypothetical protein
MSVCRVFSTMLAARMIRGHCYITVESLVPLLKECCATILTEVSVGTRAQQRPQNVLV